MIAVCDRADLGESVTMNMGIHDNFVAGFSNDNTLGEAEVPPVVAGVLRCCLMMSNPLLTYCWAVRPMR
jgi:hypothetical protein